MSKTASEKMKSYRERLRQAGLRPVQIWVPDVRSSDFAEQARTQSINVSNSASELEAINFIEALADD